MTRMENIRRGCGAGMGNIRLGCARRVENIRLGGGARRVGGAAAARMMSKGAA